MGTAIAGDKLAPGTGMHVGRELAGCTVPWECLVGLLLGPWALWTATAVAILSSSCPDAIPSVQESLARFTACSQLHWRWLMKGPTPHSCLMASTVLAPEGGCSLNFEWSQ